MDDFCPDQDSKIVKKSFWSKYWKQKKTEQTAIQECHKGIEAPTTGPGVYYTKNKKKA